MTTGAAHAIFKSTRIVGTADLKDRFQERLSNDNKETRAKVWPTDGIFIGSISFNAGLTDAFGLVEDVESTDGIGNIIKHQDATDDGTDVPFENTLAEVYHVALRAIRRPNGIRINARTGVPEYDEEIEDVGEQADPTSVTDNGNGTITFNINSVCESGHDYSGRTAIVYMKDPASGAITPAIAIETLTVAYSAPNNTITTAALLGQGTVSTDPTDYEVVLAGPTVKRDLDLSVVDGIVYLGTVTGAGAGNPPGAIDTTAQNDIDVDLSRLNDILNNFTGVRELRATRAGQRDNTFTPRYSVASVFFPDTGEIYVMGGDTNANVVTITPSALNDAYNPATDTWTARTVIPSQSNGGGAVGARAHARAAALGGLIYLMGGNNDSADFELVQRYNPLTNTWLSPAADLPATRSAGAVGVIDGFIYYAGGLTTDLTVGADNTYRYDPDLDTWTEVASIATAVVLEAGYSAFAVAPSADGDDRLYVIGGSPDGSGGSEIVVEYNAVLDQWTRMADIPPPPGQYASDLGLLQRGAAATVNGVIHVLWGTTSLFPRCSHMLYNPVLDEWSYLDDSPTPAEYQLTVVADSIGTIYKGFGLATVSGTPAITTHWSAFDASQIRVADNAGIASETGRLIPRENAGETTWYDEFPDGNAVAPFPTTRYDAAFCQCGRMLYVLGGIDDSETPQNDFWRYHVDTNTWEQLDDYTGGDITGANIVADKTSGIIYKVQGIDTGAADNTVRYYDPDLGIWSGSIGTLASPGHRSTACLIGQRIYIFGGFVFGGATSALCRYFDISLRLEVALAVLPVAGHHMNREGVIVRRRADGALAHPDDPGGSPEIWYWGGNDGANSVSGVSVYDVERDVHYDDDGPSILSQEGSNGKLVVDPDTGYQTLFLGPGQNMGGGIRAASVIDLVTGDIANPAGTDEPTVWGYILAEFDGRLFIWGGATDNVDPPASNADIVDEAWFTPMFAWPKRPASGLENMSGYNLNPMMVRSAWNGDGSDRRYARRVRRTTVAFNAGDVWGVGSWENGVNLDIIKQGEE